MLQVAGYWVMGIRYWLLGTSEWKLKILVAGCRLQVVGYRYPISRTAYYSMLVRILEAEKGVNREESDF
jgi:hypothetical protein